MQRIVSLERWKLATAVALALIIGLAIGFLVEHARATKNTSSTAAVSAPSSSPTLLPTPSAAATPSPTPTPTGAPATAAPTLSAPPPVGNGSTVVSLSGSGNNTSTLPTVADNWGLAYSFLCNGSGQFNVTVLGAGGQPVSADPPFAVRGTDAQGVQQFAKGGNGLQVQVRIDGDCQWRLNADSS